MGEDLDESLALAAGMGASAQAAAEPAFDARMDTFALPTLPVFAPMEAALHLPAVTRLGPFAPMAAGVECNDRAAPPLPAIATAPPANASYTKGFGTLGVRVGDFALRQPEDRV